MTQPPTEQDAIDIVQSTLRHDVRHIKRFSTGGYHYVYDVLTDAGPLVVRIAHDASQAALAGGVYWSGILRSKGVPIPALLAYNLATQPFSFMLLERLPGADLGHVYQQLSRAEKAEIATSVAQAQRQAGTLPAGNGFGYATGLGVQLPHRTWAGLVAFTLERSRRRIGQRGIVDARHVERVQRHAAALEADLSEIRPTAFLDDTTTKNVIVHNGKLSGIVDTDFVCYGDPLWTVGLTRMALLMSGDDQDYVAAWIDQLNLTSTQRRLLQFYTAVFCVDFMSEIGADAGNENAATSDSGKVDRLAQTLDRLLL